MLRDPSQPAAVETKACPNCGLINPDNLLICPACGVHVQRYDAAKEILSARQEAAQREQRASLEEQTRLDLEQERKNSRRRFWRFWLPGVLLATALLSVPVWLLASYAGASARVRVEAVQKLLIEGSACLSKQDFACAVLTYSRVAKLDPSNQDGRNGLWLAQIGLARIYAEQGRGDEAIAALNQARKYAPPDADLVELEVSLRKVQAQRLEEEGNLGGAIDTLILALDLRPTDAGLLDQISRLYDQWIAYQHAKGNWLMALLLRIEKAIRFP